MSMMDIGKIARNLRMNEEGIWESISGSAISYPDEGNSDCFRIEDNSFWFRHRNACILEVVRRFPPRGAVFDIGGGNGVVAGALRQGGFETVLLEPGPSGVRNARQRGIENLICSTLEDAGFVPGSMAAAGMFDVLEHIEDDRQFLSDLHSYIEPGGRLYIAVPAYNLLWSNEDDYAGHYRRYTLGMLDKVLRASGFEVDFATYFFSILPLPILLFRSLPSRLGLHRRSQSKSESEHAGASGAIGGIFDRVMGRELAVLSKGGRIPFGGSCLVAARRV